MGLPDRQQEGYSIRGELNVDVAMDRGEYNEISGFNGTDS